MVEEVLQRLTEFGGRYARGRTHVPALLHQAVVPSSEVWALLDQPIQAVVLVARV